ncbi:hypothetical protein Amal_03758 [Acetobacter malorum]|uniref:Uncharacterized protein n=1 Tax=Acetobacter malorum TaxID=178901 RepID=A0A177G6B9_9PROT|nr:hypothetical protein Amal_03758 [Acetobacter malorum]
MIQNPALGIRIPEGDITNDQIQRIMQSRRGSCGGGNAGGRVTGGVKAFRSNAGTDKGLTGCGEGLRNIKGSQTPQSQHWNFRCRERALMKSLNRQHDDVKSCQQTDKSHQAACPAFQRGKITLCGL